MSGPTLVILAAGRARRYGGIKQLAPIGLHDEATIDLIASDAVAGGFADLVLVINRETGPAIQSHVADVWPADHRVAFAFQDSLRGTVDAVLAAEAAVGPDTAFGVSNADDIYGLDAFYRLGAHLTTGDEHCLVAYHLENTLVGDRPVSRGTCSAEGGYLRRLVERRNVFNRPEGIASDDGLQPSVLDPKVLVSMNLWGFEPSIWPLLHREMEENDFTLTSEVLLPTFVGEEVVRDRLRILALETDSRCVGVTHAEDLEMAKTLIALEIAAGQRPEHAFT